MERRQFIVMCSTAIAAARLPAAADTEAQMYGLIGKIKSVAGKRDDLAAILAAAASGMPGCLSYVVANDTADESAIWVTEVWDSKDSHDASLSLPAVKDAIAKGRPLIAGFGERFVTTPVGGHGLVSGPGR